MSIVSRIIIKSVWPSFALTLVRCNNFDYSRTLHDSHWFPASCKRKSGTSRNSHETTRLLGCIVHNSRPCCYRGQHRMWKRQIHYGWSKNHLNEENRLKKDYVVFQQRRVLFKSNFWYILYCNDTLQLTLLQGYITLGYLQLWIVAVVYILNSFWTTVT